MAFIIIVISKLVGSSEYQISDCYIIGNYSFYLIYVRVTLCAPTLAQPALPCLVARDACIDYWRIQEELSLPHTRHLSRGRQGLVILSYYLTILS